MAIKEGTKVKFHYTGKLGTGEVFDSSLERDPLEFEVGKKMIIPGLEKELVKLKKGDKKSISVKADDAYGQRQDNLLREIPKGPVPEGMKLEKGAMLYLKGPDGQPIPVRIEDVKDETVVVDLNHPLAGQDLTFEVEIISAE